MAKKKSDKPAKTEPPLADLLRLPRGPVDLSSLNASATPGFPGKDKSQAEAARAAIEPALSDLQERLYAAGRAGEPGAPSILVVLQGMDTSGKGGVIRHSIGMVDPQGVKIKAFKQPTAEERAHPFLWRITRELPPPGMIGIFDRSHYEDVLVVRVNELVSRRVWSSRYRTINTWEAEARRVRHDDHQVLPARLRRRAEGAAGGPARRPDEVLEVQPGRRRRATQVAGLRRGVRGGAREVQHRPRAVVRRALGPQVVPQLGGRPAAARAPPSPRPRLAAAGVRRGDRAAPGRQELRAQTAARWRTGAGSVSSSNSGRSRSTSSIAATR